MQINTDFQIVHYVVTLTNMFLMSALRRDVAFPITQYCNILHNSHNIAIKIFFSIIDHHIVFQGPIKKKQKYYFVYKYYYNIAFSELYHREVEFSNQNMFII